MREFRFEKIQSEADGLELEMMSIVPNGEIKGILQLVHGMAENKERYQPFMQKAVLEGFVCVIHDHRGHGHIDSKNFGYFQDDTGEAIVDDVIQVGEIMRRRYLNVPLILFGHSMGSLVVRCAMKKADKNYDGLIVCGSPSKNPMSGIALSLAKLLCKIQGPKKPSGFLDKLAFSSFNKRFEPTKYPHEWICSDLEVVKAYEKDERCGFLFTNNGFVNLFTLMKKTYEKDYSCKNPNCPILFIAGEEDPCITSKKDFLEAVDFMKQVGYRHVAYKLYPHVRHEILNDVSKEEVSDDILSFAAHIVNAR